MTTEELLQVNNNLLTDQINAINNVTDTVYSEISLLSTYVDHTNYLLLVLTSVMLFHLFFMWLRHVRGR